MRTELILKSNYRKIFFYTAFLFFLGGCAQGGGSSDSGDSGSSIVPRGNGTALISWTPPTENTDGSALTDLAGYRIRYGTSPGSYSVTITLNGSGLTSYLVENLGVADWYFVMTAFNSSGIESGYSPEVYKTIN
ncbi:MAG: fibronectin type III domain-containing protein [Gammaproteobacteria bacterium]|nr:fibronectin type III domain-containing protein [Gammaproteobacteria bacterium]